MQELSRNGGILSLSHTILKLVVPECLKQSTDLAASISRLKAKILSIVSKLYLIYQNLESSSANLYLVTD